MKKKVLMFVVSLLLVFASGCGIKSENEENENSGSEDYIIEVSGEGLETDAKLDLRTLSDHETEVLTFSAINNWPTKKECVAGGVKLETILTEVGAKMDFGSIKFVGSDGYETTLTAEQINADRFYYPNLDMESKSGAREVPIIIAVLFAEDTDDPLDARECSPALIFGQTNVNEHNYVAFVENVSKIIIQNDLPGNWESATGFPQEGNVALGETIKLQHPEFGRIKMFYTLDGSEPDENSKMYNPSTYQPELNVPIEIKEDVMIKVIVTGYGKNPSEIVTLNYIVK